MLAPKRSTPASGLHRALRPDLIQVHARRTARLDVLAHAVALALGGRPGERLASRLSMPVSAETLLRLLRRRATPTPADVRVVGIDDFAWPKGQRYGTIICDLERRRTVDLLPDREGGTVGTGSPPIPAWRSCAAPCTASAEHQGHRQDDRRVAPDRAPHPGRTRDDVFRSQETTLDHWAERLNAE